MLPTVMVQELMFRGYLFTKTISRYGIVWTNVIFSIVFMLVHVIDRDVLQNPAQVVILAITIPVGHLWFAAALLRSKTILFPIGLHWGNNWAVHHVMGMHGKQPAVFYFTGEQVHNTWTNLFIVLFIFNAFFLLVTWAIWKGKRPLYFGKARVV
jgi:membrane protease YdiL (CAAX protease family)